MGKKSEANETAPATPVFANSERSEVKPQSQATDSEASWFRDDFRLLHYVCACGLAVPLAQHSADFSGNITPEVDCGNPECGGPRLVTLSGFNGGA